MISDARSQGQQNTIIANNGIIVPDDAHKAITLRLFDGSIFGVEEANNTSHVTSFRIYDLNVRPDEELGMGDLDPEEMSLPELRSTIAQRACLGQTATTTPRQEFASKFTVPFTTMLFALIGIPLGLKPARGGQSERFGVAIALFFLYYSLMRAAEALAQRGTLNAFVAMSLPDIFFATLAIMLFQRSASEIAAMRAAARRLYVGLDRTFERKRRRRIIPVLDFHRFSTAFSAVNFFGPFLVCLGLSRRLPARRHVRPLQRLGPLWRLRRARPRIFRPSKFR